MTREDVLRYAEEKYGTEPDNPWRKFPDYAVLRHAGSRKWYGLLMSVPKSKLGFAETSFVTILNLKCDPDLIGSLLKEDGVFPAYHQNREHWISIALESSFPEDTVRDLIDLSYALTAK